MDKEITYKKIASSPQKENRLNLCKEINKIGG